MYSYINVLNVLEHYNKGFNDREIESITGISKSTCNNWKKRYLNNYINLSKRYTKQHLNVEEQFLDSLEKEVFDYVEELVKENPFITYRIFITLLNKKFNIKLNNVKIKYLLKNLNITKKRIRQRTIKTEKFLEQLIENRKKFRETIKNEVIDNIISIDETGFNKLLNSNTQGYSKKGNEINIPIPELKLQNTSLLMAISVFGVVNSEITLENIDTHFYFNFINDTIKKLKNIKPDTKFIFIYDNVPFHKDKSIYDLIINNGYKILNIPAYSPNLNPIENVFGILKKEINDDIVNDMVNNNFFNNYDNINKELNKNRKDINKTLRIEEKNNEKQRILEFKKNNNKEYINKVKSDIIKIKEEAKINKENIKEKIKQIKLKNKEEKQQKVKEYIIKEKNNTKNAILNKKIKKATILKSIIEKNITKFNEKYKREQIIKIYNHAFNYDHGNIEKELRDRIKIKK